jgi:hypothetical protein
MLMFGSRFRDKMNANMTVKIMLNMKQNQRAYSLSAM